MPRSKHRNGLAEAPVLLDFAPLPASAAPVPGAEGHRARMRGRLLRAGPDALEDHEMLEMVLYLALPRRDTKAIARTLLTQFGGFSQVIAAPVGDLRQVEGLGEAGVAALKIVDAAAVRLTRANLPKRLSLSNWDQLIAYLSAQLSYEKVEQFRVLFLDSRNRLVADEVLGRGTVNHAPVYPREVVKRALQLSAAAIVLVHNHPSGDPTPSRDDIGMTEEIRAAAATMRIALHDHIVIAGGRWVSFRAKGLL